METEKGMEQECTKRNIVYDTWCRTCEKREVEKITEKEIVHKEEKDTLKKITKYKYIGESSRSAFERGLEHQRDLEELKIDSHMLKHYFDKHADEKVEDMKFGMKIIKEARTTFERQIAESVEIQNARNHHILNSKSEFNRCAPPRLSAKVGEMGLDEVKKKE